VADTLVVVSLDTEEDNWGRSRNGVTVKNIHALPRQAALFDRMGIRPTYFTTYQVVRDPQALAILKDLSAGGRAEIGAHLHPWNAPPLDETLVPRNSMMKNLPAPLQRAKLERLTEALQEGFGARPTTFRAGRYGLGRESVAALIATGYRVDSSVKPYFDLRGMDDGPSFVGAPIAPYYLAPDREVTQPADRGVLVELPLSCGFSRGPFHFWDPARRALEARPWRSLHLVGIAARTGIVRRLTLSPELTPLADMLTLARRLLEHGARHLQLSWHTPTLVPGLSPFTKTPADVERLYGSVAGFVDGLARFTGVRFATVGEAAAALLGAGRSAPAVIAC
jgi:hypothetical protein